MQEDFNPQIHGLDVNDIDRFGIDDDNNLYWDRQRVQTELKLSKLQSVWAVILTASAFVASAATILASIDSMMKEEPTHDVRLRLPEGEVTAKFPKGGGSENRNTDIVDDNQPVE